MAKIWKIILFTLIGFIMLAGGVIVWGQEQIAANTGPGGDSFLPVIVFDGEANVTATATAVPTYIPTPTVTPCTSPPPPPTSLMHPRILWRALRYKFSP